MTEKLKVLDLFSGIGGFSLGLERTGGFETVAFCEIEEFPRKVLHKHWPDVPIFEDIRRLTGEQVGSVDVITGGFPCQDISLAGKGAGIEGARSGLWSEFARLIDEVGPRWAIVENVPALRSRGLVTVLQNLCSIRYDAEWHCIPASYLGAHHRRDRICIIAYPNEGRSPTGAERSGRETRANLSRRSAWPILAHPLFNGTGERPEEVSGEAGAAAVGTGRRARPQSSDCSEVVADASRVQSGRKEQWAQRQRTGECGQPIDDTNANGVDDDSRRFGASEIRGERSQATVLRGSEQSLADTSKRRRDQSGKGKDQQPRRTKIIGASENVSDHGCRSGEGPRPEIRERSRPFRWLPEPDVGRVAHGVPNRVDRLKGLGNAFIPQIPEIIGRAILKAEGMIHD